MLKIILLIVCFVVSQSLATSKNDSLSNSEKLESLDPIKIDSNEGSSESQRRRDTGYAYPRPDRVKFGSSNEVHRQTRFRGKYIMRLPATIIKPFNKYGPPKQSSSHQSINSGHQIRRPQSQQQNRIKFQNSKPTGGFQLEVPSLIKPDNFREPSFIASQNEEPFKSNTANYLPPKNQKLPAYSAPIFQPTQSFHHSNSINSNSQVMNPHNQNFIQNHQQNSQISDATQFLRQNSWAISQLYETPATNVNYGPTDDLTQSSGEQKNVDSQFQTFEVEKNSQRIQENPRTFSGRLPAYASGFIESQGLEQIQSMEKDRLIAQLQRSLAQQDSIQSGTLQHRPNFNIQDVASTALNTVQGGSLSVSNNIPGNPSSYGVSPSFSASGNPLTTTSISSTSSTGVSNHRPQELEGVGSSSHVGTLIPTSSLTPTFSHYGGFTPTLIATPTNFVPSLPNYGTTFVTPSPSHTNVGASPTYFGLPIPTTSYNKPQSPGSPSNPGSQKPGQSTAGNQPIHPQHIPVTPLQTIFPIVPAVSSQQNPVNIPHPTFDVQPTVVSSVLRPVRPVYPVYYYPNFNYQVHKASLPTFPWSYAPSYAQAKPTHDW